jgi:hypothetical protein
MLGRFLHRKQLVFGVEQFEDQMFEGMPKPKVASRVKEL